MTILLVVMVLDDLLILLGRLERITSWCVTKVVPRDENRLWIRVASLLQLSDLVLGEELNAQYGE